MRTALLLALSFLAGAFGVALADEEYDFENCGYKADHQRIDGHTWAVVKRLDTVLFGIPVGAGGLTAHERAQVIAYTRLNPLLGRKVLDDEDSFHVGRMNGEDVIYVANPRNVAGLGEKALILTIDSSFGKFMGRSRKDLAYWWRDMMRNWAGGPMKQGTKLRDPLGRPLNQATTWRTVPAGYAQLARARELPR